MDDFEFPPFKVVHTTLVDTGSTSGEQPIKLIASPLGINIQGAGYNDARGSRTPVYLRFADGELILTVWGDINSNQPTHSISLAGAREDRRR